MCRINAKFAFFLRTRLATFVYNSEFFFTCLRKSLIANLQEKNFQIIIYFSSYHIQDLKEVSSLWPCSQKNFKVVNKFKLQKFLCLCFFVQTSHEFHCQSFFVQRHMMLQCATHEAPQIETGWKLLGWNSCTEAFKPLTTWKYSKLWILLHSIWWPLHIFLIVLCGIVLHSMSRRNNKIEKSTGFKQMYKLWVMIYENFKNMYERLKNTTLFTIHVLTCKLY